MTNVISANGVLDQILTKLSLRTPRLPTWGAMLVAEKGGVMLHTEISLPRPSEHGKIAWSVQEKVPA